MSKRSRRARSAGQPVSRPGTSPANKRAARPAQPQGAPAAVTAGAPQAAAQPAAAQPAAAEPGTARPTGARPTGARAGRRERARPMAQQKSFFERYRLAIVGVVGVAAIALIAVWAFNSASAAAFSCSSEWVPNPTASPAAGAAPQPGYHQESMGQSHIGPGTSSAGEAAYTYCPPASGPHFQRGGPISPGAYGPDDIPLPQGWIHNLEHGGLVVLYRGRPGDPGLEDATQQELQSFYSGLPPSPVCNFPPTQDGAGVTIVRFDDMATPFAALVWERVLPLDTFDEDAIMEFWTTYGERTNPEKFCATPSEAPSSSHSSPAPS